MTILVLLTETVFAVFSSQILKMPTYVVEILYNEKDSLDHVLRFCKDNRLSIVNLKIHTLDDPDEATYSAEVTLRGTMPRDELILQAQQMPGIVSVTGV